MGIGWLSGGMFSYHFPQVRSWAQPWRRANWLKVDWLRLRLSPNSWRWDAMFDAVNEPKKLKEGMCKFYTWIIMLVWLEVLEQPNIGQGCFLSRPRWRMLRRVRVQWVKEPSFWRHVGHHVGHAGRSLTFVGFLWPDSKQVGLWTVEAQLNETTARLEAEAQARKDLEAQN